LLEVARHGIVMLMKTANVQQLPEQWPQILRWVAAGEEVDLTEQDKVVAKVVPPTTIGEQPDFLARAKSIWGEKPSGKPLSAIVAEARGGEP
jgi:antitoxin (DNA-binding transcriptional repressor) of toxin-antitoxin stability system